MQKIQNFTNLQKNEKKYKKHQKYKKLNSKFGRCYRSCFNYFFNLKKKMEFFSTYPAVPGKIRTTGIKIIKIHQLR